MQNLQMIFSYCSENFEEIKKAYMNNLRNVHIKELQTSFGKITKSGDIKFHLINEDMNKDLEAFKINKQVIEVG